MQIPWQAPGAVPCHTCMTEVVESGNRATVLNDKSSLDLIIIELDLDKYLIPQRVSELTHVSLKHGDKKWKSVRV